MPGADVHLLEGFLHEVFNEVERARPFALMTKAVDGFVPAAAPASTPNG